MRRPYLGTANKNNGVLDFVEAEAKITQKDNCMAFIKNDIIYNHAQDLASGFVNAAKTCCAFKYILISVHIADTITSIFH